MGKVITVWGSPGSGKSMFSCILAKALTRDKRKAIIINAEISVPMLPVWLPEQIIQTNASVGQVLSSHANATRFLREADASLTAVNASTRFNDGGQLGLGAEIGICTSKLHSYGAMGVRELTTTKFVALGTGQIRE